MNDIVTKCRKLLQTAYGSRFAGLILYGSSARGDDRKDSDIDLLVLLDGSFDYFKELRNITELLYTVQLESDRLISAKPAATDEYRAGRLQLYRNVLREGAVI